MEYRIYYSFSGYGTTYIEADNEEAAREMFENGDYEGGDEETENYEIAEVFDPEELAAERQSRTNRGIIDNPTMPTNNENLCRCGNPVEEKGEICDQCWAAKTATTPTRT